METKDQNHPKVGHSKTFFMVASVLALAVTIFLYWPIYQKIQLNDQSSNVDQEVRRLNLPLGEDIKEILDRGIQLPLDRHEICLENRNRFHFFHSDSNSLGVPFMFYTNDLNQNNFGKINKLAAMGITFYYQDYTSENLLYREFGSSKECNRLEIEKLNKYASSTIEYSYVGLNRLEELDLGENGKLAILRSIVGGYFIDTSKSSLLIVARWEFFLLTFVILLGLFFTAIKYISKYSDKIFPKFISWFKK